MQDYSKYPYNRLLEYIETMCKKRGEERDFVKYLLSMNHAESIEKMMEMYDNLYKLLAVLFFGTNKLPRYWYIPESWGHDNTYLIEELNWCLNENILKWYKRQNNPSEEICLKCLANLRESENLDAMKGEIMECFPDIQIVSPLVSKLSWTHFLIVMPLKDELQREFYLTLAASERWSKRTLQNKIDGMLFERTAVASKPDELIKKELATLRDDKVLSNEKMEMVK